jgi:Phage tail tube protein
MTMATNNRRGGVLSLNLDGVRLDIKGSWTYNLGKRRREAVVGADAVHGFKETPQTPYMEGEISDRADLDVAALFDVVDATVTLQLVNGKTIVLRNGWFAGEGTVGTEEGNVACRFEGLSCEEV